MPGSNAPKFAPKIALIEHQNESDAVLTLSKLHTEKHEDEKKICFTPFRSTAILIARGVK